MTLNEFFKSIGYDISYINSEFSSINNYMGWYKGFVESFHKYYVYNGESRVDNERYSLCVPKKVCETFADLLINEKVRITLGKDKNTKILNDILNSNNFHVKANQGIEKTFALGTGCFLLSLDKNPQNIKIQFVNAINIYPLKFDNDGITECAFANESDQFNIDTQKSEKIINLQLHILNEYKNYTIKNFRFIEGTDGNLTRIPTPDVLPVFETNNSFRWFIPIKPNISNNFNLNSPFGIPIYANSLDTIKAIDLTYDSLVNEIQNGRKRLFVTQEAMKVGSDGRFKNAFDPNDVVFYILDGNFGDSKPDYVQEVNGELRVTDLKNALQTHLDLLFMKLGLGGNYFKFDENAMTRTATEVISENSQMFRTIKKHEQVLENALIEMTESIIEIGNQYGIFDIRDEEINIDFDDSIIESKEQNRIQDRQDVDMEAQSLVEYRMNWYGEDEKTAKAKIEEIKNQNKDDHEIEFSDE